MLLYLNINHSVTTLEELSSWQRVDMQKQASDVTSFMGTSSLTRLFAKIRSALVFSVLSTMMKKFNRLYSTVDIITVALSVYFICALLRAVVLRNQHTRHHFHIGYLLHSMSRQSVLIVSDAVAHSVHLRDVGTQQENTLILVLSTSALVALLTLLPSWFLKDTQQGSLKDLLIYSFTSRYSQLHVPGLQGDTGIGVLAHGLLFVVFNMLDNLDPDGERPPTELMRTLYQTTAMVFSNMFLVQIAPESSSQVLPVAILLGMYIVSDHLPMSDTVASFVLWRTAAETSTWITRVLPGSITDQVLLFAVLFCVLPALDRKIASVLAVAALQTVVGHLMHAFTYLGTSGSAIASVCMMLVSDVVLDPRD